MDPTKKPIQISSPGLAQAPSNTPTPAGPSAQPPLATQGFEAPQSVAPVNGATVRPLGASPTVAPAAAPVRPAMPIGQQQGVGLSSSAGEARPVNINGINSAVGMGNVTPGIDMNASGALTDDAFASTPATQPPNVSFADPAEQPVVNDVQNTDAPRKKSNKKVLIALAIVAFLVAAALAVVLVMMALGLGPFGNGNSSDSGQNSNSSQTVNSNGSSNNSNSGGNSTNNGNTNGGTTNGTNGSNNGGSANSNSSTGSSNGAVVCSKKSNENGLAMDLTMTFNVVNGKMTDVVMSVVAHDSSDGTNYEDTETYTVEEMLGENGVGDKASGIITSDGTLKVSIAELSNFIQDNLGAENKDMTCSPR